MSAFVKTVPTVCVKELLIFVAKKLHPNTEF